MALIACVECAELVADSALFCPRCGVSAPGGRSACVTVHRRAAVTLAVQPVNVWVDGLLVGALSIGEGVRWNVASGRHEVVVGVAPAVGRTKYVHGNFEVRPGECANYWCGFTAMLGRFILQRA